MAAAESSRKTPEHERLEQARAGEVAWKAWGPYLSERQWGTVREDYSDGGDAWNYFTHDQARSRAYRWGEDGIAGICDERQRLCLALALWNGADPILKERMFGLTNGEGNHGEDVKEYWFYLDSTPTHSYLKCQYKYPQRAFPYDDLRRDQRPPGQAGHGVRAARHRHLRRGPLLRRRRRVRQGRATTTSSCSSRRTTAGPTRRRCTCCRRSGSATRGRGATSVAKPPLAAADGRGGMTAATATHPELGDWLLLRRRLGAAAVLRERDQQRAPVRRCRTPRPYVKDGDQRLRRRRRRDAVNPERTGTKVAAHHVLEIAPGRERVDPRCG